ncbi:MAG: deoxyribose-phosphate aldolase [Pontiellaceae bacterium]|nr:deoxyribose-phosphate aldolase [Pontiellaceae bacterium]
MKNHYSLQEVAATIDHAVLKPNQTESDLRSAVDLCIKYKTASLCVRPCDIRLAAELLIDSNVKVSCVLSFPHGYDTPKTKIFQARQAILNGVHEIDMVMNIGQFLSGHHNTVMQDIQGVVNEAHDAGVLVKVIQESGYLTLDQVAQACTLAQQAGADYVKTSTGFSPTSASPEIIEVMVRTVGGSMGVKASGGIRTWEQAVGYLRQGATRLGVGTTRQILEAGKADSLDSY